MIDQEGKKKFEKKEEALKCHSHTSILTRNVESIDREPCPYT